MNPKRTCFNLNHGITRGAYGVIQVKITQTESEWAPKLTYFNLNHGIPRGIRIIQVKIELRMFPNEHVLTWNMAYSDSNWARMSSNKHIIYFNLNHNITRGYTKLFQLKFRLVLTWVISYIVLVMQWNNLKYVIFLNNFVYPFGYAAIQVKIYRLF